MTLIDIYRIYNINLEEYTFYPAAHANFSKINHMLGHKSLQIQKD